VERLPYILVIAAWAYVTVGHLLPEVAGPRLRSRARSIAAFAVIVHLLALAIGALTSPYPTGLPEALSSVALGLGIAYVWLARQKMHAVGILLAPLSLVLVGTALVVPHRSVAALEQTGYSAWLPIHLGLIFSGLAGFAVSSVVGGMFLYVRRNLKEKRFAAIARLPSLEVLDRFQFRAMLFGFVFLTLGIGAGGAWAAVSLADPWAFDPKIAFTLLIWAWYGAALQVRLVSGRRGRWTALFSIVGFAGLLFSMVGLNFLLNGWHSYGG
jgi:ABC-type transport system involved in cytochrome c biogenesis permease subunit